MSKQKHKQEYWPDAQEQRSEHMYVPYENDPTKYNLNLVPEKDENPWIVGAAVLMLSFTLAYLIVS